MLVFTKKPEAELKNAVIAAEPHNPQKFRLRGDVYGHPNFQDGEMVETSRILKLDFVNNTAETKNTIYKFSLVSSEQ
jgi:hypothetical protein